MLMIVSLLATIAALELLGWLVLHHYPIRQKTSRHPALNKPPMYINLAIKDHWDLSDLEPHAQQNAKRYQKLVFLLVHGQFFAWVIWIVGSSVIAMWK